MDVIAHGGAGSPPDDPSSRQAVLDNAAARGLDAATPLDAVVATINVLESDPAFNAGVGSAVQSDGDIRTDAGLMTDDGEVGAACAMTGVEHAVDVARAVLEETPHVLLAGEPARDFAFAHGIETDSNLWTERTRNRWQDASPGESVSDHLAWLADHFGGHDTVGAVATDGERIAAGTSTGGRWGALAGRVGDVPQIGAGFYTSSAGGASATGAGEDIAREALARAAVERLESGGSPQTAAREAIESFEERAVGTAGVIVLAEDGTAGSAYNSDAMQTATARR
ncbi:isoaspartyl peptidase/L-asparaginase [Halorhabdus sp. BNX81]|uniref:isoaspartyl peptidase/L-asparaginase n=1 Tax=Halorhabdus sp. BNX81 TaxID=2980181 RepID=UPI0023DD3ABF|nr:isoaspartyl peptidase/L-asparaginase [Halorhabdus sp. BNX81]WEL21216.1 L-asparaginase / beta-aspartyl-peptidase [Halorhabdus sp. BNX81]